MRNIKITIEYDGTNYAGWQIQKNAVTIQEVMEKAVSSLVFHNISVIGSSRTDAGVHAKGMVANFLTSSSIPIRNFPAAINSKLPYDIAVVDAEEVNEDFHSRYNSIGKRYSYLILNRRAPSPILRNYAAHIPQALDVTLMKEGALHLVGTHDFSAFKSSGSSIKNNVRTVRLLELVRNGDIITMEIEANGFLYNMVRIIAGTLIDTGLGKITPEEVKEILCSRNRNRAGKTAPPQGLYLEKVFY